MDNISKENASLHRFQDHWQGNDRVTYELHCAFVVKNTCSAVLYLRDGDVYTSMRCAVYSRVPIPIIQMSITRREIDFSINTD